jgi:hypothetical protein
MVRLKEKSKHTLSSNVISGIVNFSAKQLVINEPSAKIKWSQIQTNSIQNDTDLTLTDNHYWFGNVHEDDLLVDEM